MTPARFLLFLGLAWIPSARGALPPTARIEDQVDRAGAVCRARVVRAVAHRGARDPMIWTRYEIEILERIKGRFPARLEIWEPGGVSGGDGLSIGCGPALKSGEEYVLFLGQRPEGTLYVRDGAAGALRVKGGGRPAANLLARIRRRAVEPASGQALDLSTSGISVQFLGAPPGVSTNSTGVPARFVAPDRGEAVPYLVDMQAMPAGITTNQALAAISNAFRAWSLVSSISFRFEGVTNFGQAASAVTNADGRVRVQLHDLHNAIPPSSVLGIGGRGFSISSTFSNGGMGGNVRGVEFFPATRGFIVLEHTNTTLQNPVNLEEALCHEAGHVIGLAHSSEASPEPSALLSNAMMYYRLHGDGRGASLGAYDPPVVDSINPLNDTPPWLFDRMMSVVTTSPQSHGPGFNEVRPAAGDLQGSALAIALSNQTLLNGWFVLTNGYIRYHPSNAWSDSAQYPPSGSQHFDRVYVRAFDATNASPIASVRVLSFQRDRYPAGAFDGMPDTWMTNFFGTGNPAADPRFAASADFDGDGSSNLDEFRNQTNPTNAADSFRVTFFAPTNLQWRAAPYEVYEVQRSRNLSNWARAASPEPPTTTNGAATAFASTNAPHEFYRVFRLP